MNTDSPHPIPLPIAPPTPQRGEGVNIAALCRGPAQKRPLASQSRGRGSWDCVRQMQMYRRRPDVLAAALRDMGFSATGDDIPDVQTNESDDYQTQRDNALN